MYGLRVPDPSSSNNEIWNNTFYHNNGAGDVFNAAHIQASDAGANNHWNNSVGCGNYWSDRTTPDVIAPWGIVDNPYNIAGSSGAKGYFPLIVIPAPIPELSNIISPIIGIIGVIFTIRYYRRRP